MRELIQFLAIVGPMIGFLVVVCAAPVMVYSFFAGTRRRGFIASGIAIALSVLAVLLSSVTWYVMLRGYGSHGEPIDYGDPVFVVLEIIAGLETLVLLLSILGAALAKTKRAA